MIADHVARKNSGPVFRPSRMSSHCNSSARSHGEYLHSIRVTSCYAVSHSIFRFISWVIWGVHMLPRVLGIMQLISRCYRASLHFPRKCWSDFLHQYSQPGLQLGLKHLKLWPYLLQPLSLDHQLLFQLLFSRSQSCLGSPASFQGSVLLLLQPR